MIGIGVFFGVGAGVGVGVGVVGNLRGWGGVSELVGWRRGYIYFLFEFILFSSVGLDGCAGSGWAGHDGEGCERRRREEDVKEDAKGKEEMIKEQSRREV